MHSVNNGNPAGAGKWGIKEYVFALAGMVLILFVAGFIKWENGSVALTDRSEHIIENMADGDDQTEAAPEPLPEGWVKVNGTGYSYGHPDWYYAEPEDKFAISDRTTADSIATDGENLEDSTATFFVLKSTPSGFDDFDVEDYAKVLGKTWIERITWSEIELNGRPATSFTGRIENSGVTVLTRQVVVPDEGIIVDMKYHEGSGTKNTLEKILHTWTWDE
jgi:hypothetical protein